MGQELCREDNKECVRELMTNSSEATAGVEEEELRCAAASVKVQAKVWDKV